jgi:ribosomal-protein-alanine N-acetyltransferase
MDVQTTVSALSAKPLPVLKGKAVFLRPFEAADITADYMGWLNDPETMRFSNQRFIRHSQANCEQYLIGFKGSSNHFLSIRLQDNDVAVGTATAYVSTPHGTVDLGILVGERRLWGRGIGLDAFKTLVEWWLHQPGIRKVTAGTLAANVGMVNLALRAGLHLEAVRRAQELVDGQAVDMHYFARFADADT